MTDGAVLLFSRNSHFFVDNAGKVEDLESRRELVQLASDQLLHPPVPRYYIVRKGKVRISQFLDDGREITRTVLQAGSVFYTQRAQDHGDKPAADLYCLSGIVIMALGEAELWAFSENQLDDIKELP
jgi:hypothetical protein